MKIDSQLFDAFLKCPTKCFLLSRAESGTGNAYADWIRAQNESFGSEGVKRWITELPQIECAFASPLAEDLKTVKWRRGAHLVAQAYPLEAQIHALERVPSQNPGKPAQLIPVRFVFTNKLTRDDKLLLGFDAFVLSQMLNCTIDAGTLIHGKEHAKTKVKTAVLANDVRELIGKATKLLDSTSPPELVLNRHCFACEFRSRCRQTEIEKDDLSLLSSMTEKERLKFKDKGIFTVTQLSYTFRPRRRPRRLAAKRERYHHSLKALAIRESKIHISGSPQLTVQGTPVYLDVEGLPDIEFYYLIGVRIRTAEGVGQHSLWADNREDERHIWLEFLNLLSRIENPVLVHYGSFETTFLKRMWDRYGKPPEGSEAAKAVASPVNVLSFIYAQIYFPTFSNGLKDIAGQLGFRWSDPTASGVQSIVWRDKWDATSCPTAKQALITYNSNDCEALELVVNSLATLQAARVAGEQSSRDDVVNTDGMRREHPYGFNRNSFAFPELEAINKAAYWDYQRERIYVKSDFTLKRTLRQLNRVKVKALRPNKIVECPRPGACPKCSSTILIKRGPASKTVLDVRFMKHGIKRWITRYKFHRYTCRGCGVTFYPENRPWTRSKYGSELVAFSVYQNIELRLPQETVDRSLNKLFGFHPGVGRAGRTSEFKQRAATAYEETYNALVERVCAGSLVHADETKVSVGGKDGYVWVFANMKEVVYVYSETREADLLRGLLKNFTGVLVSDFYAAYDGIQCPQQKCLIHLIRDLNDAILKHPYDEELRDLVKRFADLVKPMIETVDRRGLKCRFLRKHLLFVDGFYKQLSKTEFRRDPAMKCKERFEKNRNKLFTFLTHDGVPWNNNNAEHAVKAFAMLRHVIDGVTSEKGIREYLVLLSICQTCKYKNLDFLEFLRSGDKDLVAFERLRRAPRSPA